MSETHASQQAQVHNRICLLSPQSHPSLGDNLNGPSVIEVPRWVQSPLGRYYMYFAHHKGRFIRMAYANSLEGPWRVHAPGVLNLEETPFVHDDLPAESGIEFGYAHIASPNVHVDNTKQLVVLYYHGLEPDGSQSTRVCFSSDGLLFGDHSGVLSDPYLAGFSHDDAVYGVTWGGGLCRGEDWSGPFEHASDEFANALCGPNSAMPRHFGVLVEDGQLQIFFTRIGDAPERILKSTCNLSKHWLDWRASAPAEVMSPLKTWEGVESPVSPSRVGTAEPMEHALRDPFPFQGHLFYAGGGESAIGVTRL